MSPVAKFAPALAAVVLTMTALAGCTATVAPATESAQKASVGDAPAPKAASNSTEMDSDDCVNPAWITISDRGASVSGDIVDRGTRAFAEGTVGYDDDGAIVTYTVAPGDATEAIGERLCIENSRALTELNHTRLIHPDQVLRLTAHPDLLFVPYFAPWDAPAGFEQIPYQEAIDAMGAAADAGDVNTMRHIWADTLAGMFTNPADSDGIQQALDAGDLDVLREMFS